MSERKKKRDIISEQEFNIQARAEIPLPEYDSPGDSDEGLNQEYLLGLNYMPDERNEYEGAAPEELIPADEKSTAGGEIPDGTYVSNDEYAGRIPETAKVISSDPSDEAN